MRDRPSPRILLRLAVACTLAASIGAAPAPAATAMPSPWWRLGSRAAPSYMVPGKEARIIAIATDVGEAPVITSSAPLVVTDKLPGGLKLATGKPPTTFVWASTGSKPLNCTVEGAKQLSCATEVSTTSLEPYRSVEVRIPVEVEEGAASGEENTVTVSGGEAPGRGPAPSKSLQRPITVNEQATPFGVEDYELANEEEGGLPDIQAGSHPFQLTIAFDLNQTLVKANGETYPSTPIAPRALHFALPPGLIGDTRALPQCLDADFSSIVGAADNACPADTALGVATVDINLLPNFVGDETVPIFNLVPAPGEPARFGFEADNVFVILDTSVATGGDYHATVSINNATESAQILGTQLTLWGEPAQPIHASSRGWSCLTGETVNGAPCGPSDESGTPFLTLPTSCEGPLSTAVAGESWPVRTVGEPAPGEIFTLVGEYALRGGLGEPLKHLEGCQVLPFTPSFGGEAAAEQESGPYAQTHAASTPTGLSLDAKIPQRTTLAEGGLAESALRDTTVTLPQGVQLSPSAANGLQACTEAQVGYQGLNPTSQTQEFTSLPAACPDPSKLGTVEIETPLLPGPMTGSIYLAEPAPSGEPGKNPFGSLAAVYMVAEEPTSRVLVKLAGEAKVSETTGQVTATFHNTPQLPFENLELKLFSGPRASLTSPSLCGTYQTEASLTPWSGTAMVSIVSPPGESFQITSGPGGSQCSPDPQVFAPGFQAGSTNLQAGAFTSFALELSRPDGDEALQGVALHLPSGFAAMLSSVQLCEEPQASRDECPQGSEVGQATAVAGLGPEPYTEAGGRVYITGPDGGAPFGLEIVAPAVAGPFDLGTVTVRSKIYINPADASLTIVSDPVPTQLKGIPLQLKRVLVSVDHPNFQFNPTACNPTKIEGRLTGAASFAGGPGATATVSSPFQLANCASLPFAPKLTASTYGQASKAGGASLDVKVQTAGLGDANIAKVDLQLPKALPARLTTLQKACTSATFEANPATCPEASNIGVATIHTPILRNPLSGPGYLVSHGGTAFPDIEFVLQGEGVTIVLDGKTVIKNGITHSNFESAPDAPFTTFEAVLPAGPHSALAANVPKYHLCGTKLAMPTVITGQNGAVIRRMTTIAVGGCKAVKASRTKKLTRAQKLSRALKACRKNYRRSRSRRTACERNARDAYKARPLRRPLR